MGKAVPRRKARKARGSYDDNLNRPNPFGRIHKESEIRQKNFGQHYLEKKNKKELDQAKTELMQLVEDVTPNHAARQSLGSGQGVPLNAFQQHLDLGHGVTSSAAFPPSYFSQGGTGNNGFQKPNGDQTQ